MKNRLPLLLGKPFFDIMYNEGISRESELIELGVEHDIVEKTGAWYSYNGDRLGQGKENVRQFLKDSPEVAAEIEKLIREKVIPVSKVEQEAEQEEES